MYCRAVTNVRLLQRLLPAPAHSYTYSGSCPKKSMSSSASAAGGEEAVVPMTSVLESIHEKMAAATEVAKAKGAHTHDPRLVAVSKTKPLSAILDAYAAGQRRFGENYVQELVEKAADPACPDDIEWHFIGTLQSNKAKLVAGAKGLAVIETITSVKLANMVEKALVAKGREDPLPVYVQVNTSGEEAKGGVAPEATSAIVAHIREQCPHLSFAGLMTIGEYGRVMEPGQTNPDFIKLVECRTAVAAAAGLENDDVEISMGMSGDYVHAIELGSTNVRVGSTIFGARQYANPK